MNNVFVVAVFSLMAREEKLRREEYVILSRGGTMVRGIGKVATDT